MPIFRKKPLEVEAEQFTDKTKDRVLTWMTGNHYADFEDGVPTLRFMTIHGDEAVARLGDWVVKDGAPGAYYPVKDSVFIKTYEAV